jgi:phage-related tail protein
LELAQRESARSLAQDASRNGVNLSVYLSRLERLAGALATAKELAATSARYQEQVAAVEKSMADLERAAREQFQGYRDKVGKLGEYSREHREFAFQQLESSKVTSREREVLTLLKKHVAIFADQRRADPDAWFEDFRKQFRGFLDS